MLDPVLVKAPLQSPVVPKLVRDLVVAHLSAEDPAEGCDNIPKGKHLADHRVELPGGTEKAVSTPAATRATSSRYRVKEKMVDTSSSAKQHPDGHDENPVRQRILGAAFSVSGEHGFAGSNTLEIATRARVSKRELYALVGNKQEMLVACISGGANRLRMPEELPLVRDRETLARVLVSFGAQLLREVSDPTVVAVFRLAIAEAERNPNVSQALDTIGRETSRAALAQV